MEPHQPMSVRAVDIRIPTSDLERSLQFYLDELQYFVKTARWGMGWAALQLRHAPGIGEAYFVLNELLSVSVTSPEAEGPLMTLCIDNAQAEFARLGAMSLASGARVLSTEVFVHPLVESFLIADPFGNVIKIEHNRELSGDGEKAQ